MKFKSHLKTAPNKFLESITYSDETKTYKKGMSFHCIAIPDEFNTKAFIELIHVFVYKARFLFAKFTYINKHSYLAVL